MAFYSDFWIKFLFIADKTIFILVSSSIQFKGFNMIQMIKDMAMVSVI